MLGCYLYGLDYLRFLVSFAITMPDSDFESVVVVVASSLGNGPTLGDYGPSNTWASMGAPSAVITSILMWFGRLEHVHCY